MIRIREVLALIAVACLVSGAPWVLGQVEQRKPAAPAAPAAPRNGVDAPGKVMEKKPAKGKNAIARKALVAAPVNDQAALYLPRFRPVFRLEYYFLRNVCDLTAEQRKTLARMGEAVCRTAAGRFAEAMQERERNGRRQGSYFPNPQRLIENELKQRVGSFLSHRQNEQYREELNRRAEFQRRITIDNVVMRLDQRLILSPDQRARLIAVLRAEWKDQGHLSLMALENQINPLPALEERLVGPILTEEQKRVWRGTPRSEIALFQFLVMQLEMQNDPLDDPEWIEAIREVQLGGGQAGP